jgi:penicillin-binding protein 2
MRKALLPGLILVSAILLTIRIFYLQVLDDSFKLKAENNAIKIKYDYPERGYIYDRTGKLLVANQPSYDIMVVPRDVKMIDTLEFCQLLNITKDYFIKRMVKAKVHSPMLPYVFVEQLNKSEFAAFQEKIRNFEGFYFQKRSLRDYQINCAANIFGFITQVTPKLIDKNPYYNSGDLIGMQGVEQSYEEVLRGVKGVKYIQKDKFNREIGPYKEGIFDTIAKQGNDITLSIDSEIQKYGEELMVNKRGGIVAIEPKTGEILALVTAPSYDPAILVGRQKSANYTKLYHDSIAKPLYDRGLLAEYPPGSPFKIMTGLAGLQEQAITEETTFICHHGFYVSGGHFMGCHSSAGPYQLHNGIAQSCNAYFANVFINSIAKYPDPNKALDIWSDHIKSFGLGQFMGYDLPTGKKGKIPTSKTYKKMYSGWQWSGRTIVSNSIGQGEVLTTPIQLANMMSAVANEGYYYTPHIIKKIKGTAIDTKFTTKHVTTIDKKYFKPMISGLFDVYNLGTAYALRVEGIDICGKTGTAENFAKINGKRTKLEDHSIFVAFAPKDNPKIAIAVMVENGGFGARIAGPIASLMIEKYLKHKITRTDLQTRVLTKSLIPQYAKLGGLSKEIMRELFLKDSIEQAKKIKPKAVVKKDTTANFQH